MTSAMLETQPFRPQTATTGGSEADKLYVGKQSRRVSDGQCVCVSWVEVMPRDSRGCSCLWKLWSVLAQWSRNGPAAQTQQPGRSLSYSVTNTRAHTTLLLANLQLCSSDSTGHWLINTQMRTHLWHLICRNPCLVCSHHSTIESEMKQSHPQ